MYNRKLAILGASYLQKPLVLKAKALGLETHCFAWSEGAVCKDLVDYFYPISVLDKEKVLEECIRINIDGIVSIASDIVVPTWSFIAENMNLNANSIQVAKNCTNKYLMKSELLKKQIKGSAFVLITHSDSKDIDQLFHNEKYPLIVKPVDRSGSRGVTKVLNIEELKSAVIEALEISIAGEVIVEQFVSGKEYSVEAISVNNKHEVLTITEKVTTGSPYFVELEHHQPAKVNEKLKSEIIDFTKNVLDSIGVSIGATHTELIVDTDNQLSIIEVGARMGGDFIGSHLVHLSTGIDYVKLVIDCALGNPISIKAPKTNNKSGVLFLINEKQQEFVKNNNFSPIELFDEKANIDQIISSADRKGYIIYQKNKV